MVTPHSSTHSVSHKFKMAGFLAGGLAAAMDLGAGFAATAPLYANYAMGAGQMAAGGLMQGAAGLAGSELGGKFLGSMAGGLGLGLGKMALNRFTGKNKGSGGCSCQQQQAPKMSCEDKCMYGRYMAQKCQGCKGYKKKSSSCYRKTYSGGSYSSGQPYGYIPYGGATPRKSGRQWRKSMRQSARQTRRTNRQTARQNRRANRRS